MDAPVSLIDDLCALAENYLEPDQIKEIRRAYLFGAKAHEGQLRASGEPFIHHPLQVARILVEMRLDYKSVIAALLHDVIEDTSMAKAQIAEQFGTEVAELVDGVSKLTQMTFVSQAEEHAENFRKMLLAMARDIRVILVKLADRLHNMRTLGALSPSRRRKIARETLDIYAPIANRLGLHNILVELEDLGFAALYPMRYRVLAEQVNKASHRRQFIQKLEKALHARLTEEKLPARVTSRNKNLYHIYRKMRTRGLSFSEVFEVYNFRIIVDTVDACYRVLGAVHNLYKPLPGKFKDYIAIPKSNGYQSLHTALFGPSGVPIQVQICTEEMEKVAECGIASHWQYKNGEAGADAAHHRARQWLRKLLEMQKQAGNTLEFIDSVKTDLFPDEVYVFTPAGEIMGLPRGATAVDLAYAVHTDVGNTCVAVKIDRRYAPLRTPLLNGQTVEVVTAPWGRPNPAWLNFVVTGKARAGIRNHLKNLRRGEAVDLGRRLVNQSLASEVRSLTDIPWTHIERLLCDLGLTTWEDLLEEIGLGKRIAPLVIRRLLPPGEENCQELGGGGSATASAPQPLLIKGTEGMVVNFAKCCHPIPDDPIVGFLSTGRGLVIHTQSCKNVSGHVVSRTHLEKWIDVAWEPNVESELPVEIRIQAENHKGVLATLAATISDMGSNIDNVVIADQDGPYTSLLFTIDVMNRGHLAQIIQRLRTIPVVSDIHRTGS